MALNLPNVRVLGQWTMGRGIEVQVDREAAKARCPTRGRRR